MHTSDTPENYYAILGVPIDADNDTLKRAYRQLARRYHPDLAGPEGALQMKRINRAYSVLNDAEQRHKYDTIIGGVVDLRGTTRPRVRPRRFEQPVEEEFEGLSIFSTKGPFRTGVSLRSNVGVISALNGRQTNTHELLIVGGSFDGKGTLWQIAHNTVKGQPISFEIDPEATVESLRELRLSEAGSLLAGWGRLSLHVWDTHSGQRLWSYPLEQRAVSAPYSIDMALSVEADGTRQAHMALPLLPTDIKAPRAWGVRGTDIQRQNLGKGPELSAPPLPCLEENIEQRSFWAIRLRALSYDARRLLTLSCAQVAGNSHQVVIARRWDLTTQNRSKVLRPQIIDSLEVGNCEECAPPYIASFDARLAIFTYQGNKLRICDIASGTYSELPTGAMGSSARLAISPDCQLLAVAREDSEISEGVIDIWSLATGQLVQKLYHPWQISALNFTDHYLLVALTDGTIHIWNQ
ncbi:DnaJ domain-containing protein [Ktedonospora formicarum]|uniref:J domain-containing protein n=1 Tax=Ktedonospora formicarum TaxID=2778364 RepID=A0A8J3I3G2_9CHLR|nr:DnaJ domain-containing protein [Ktedonospora formicarum]GHO44764.1 hypothetical protein KSX_29270 [Ktedonospora formicarum]